MTRPAPVGGSGSPLRCYDGLHALVEKSGATLSLLPGSRETRRIRPALCGAGLQNVENIETEGTHIYWQKIKAKYGDNTAIKQQNVGTANIKTVKSQQRSDK